MSDKEKIFLNVLENHKGIIYKIANAYCSDHLEKDDLIQEIIIQVWLSLDRYNDKYQWSTWIYRVALNTSISHFRKNKARLEKTVRLSPILEVPSDDFEHSKDENFLLLQGFIRELKEIDKALILLHLEGLSSNEIADILNTTPSNVTTKTSRIRKKLKLKFEEHKRNNHG